MAITKLPSTIIPIEVNNLKLDTENFRLGPQPNEEETVKAMIDEQREKLVVLAKDIIDHGLNPFDLITVCPTGEKDKYRVIEGNRRITALKLLREPSLAVGTDIEKEIRDLALKSKDVVTEAECRVLPTKKDAFIWIQRKHDFGLGGAGTEGWHAVAIRRAKESLGEIQAALKIVDFVAKHSTLSATDKAKLERMPITNLERIIEDPNALSLLGVEVRGADVICQYDKEWTLAALSRVVRDIATKKVKVGEIFHKPQREKYVKNVIAAQPVAAKKVGTWSLVTGSAASASATNKAGGKTIPLDRKHLIPKSCKIPIPHARINEIYDELRTKLKLEEMVNSVSVMFRVFMELSADHYIGKHHIRPPNDKLINKLKAIADDMKNKGVMTDKQLKPLRLALSDPNDVLSTETLNAYVHNLAVMPKAKDLRRTWDSIEPFITKLWA